MRIFLSSTYADLADEREAVYQRLKADGHDIVRMEDFGSRDDVPIETCLAAVESCEVYVLLLGVRYGSIADQYNLSYTQVEYERARQCGLHVLAYVREGFDARVATADDPVRLADFRVEIERAHTVRRPYFSSPDGLARQVAEDVRALERQLRVRPAFVPGRRAIQDTQAYATQTVRYRRLQLSPIVVVVVDLGAARLKKNPEERGRRMTQKVREIAAFLETQGANSLVFNNIPAPGPADILEQRAKEATERADLIVCLVRGASDAADLQRFLDGQANVAVWYPDRFDLDLPEGVRVASYSPTELQDCGLALDVQDYLDAVIDDHVLKQRG